MRCSRTVELLSRKLDGRLHFREKEALRSHVGQCARCRQLQAEMEADSLNLRRVMRFAKPDVRDFVERTMAVLTEREEIHHEETVGDGGSSLSVASSAPRRRLQRWMCVQTVALAASVMLLAWALFVHGPKVDSELRRMERDLGAARAAAGRATPAMQSPGWSRAGKTLGSPDDTETHGSAASAGLGDPASLASTAETGTSGTDSSETDTSGDGEEAAGSKDLDTPGSAGEGELADGTSASRSRSATDLVAELLQAIQRGDLDEVDRVTTMLLGLRQDAERAAELLMDSYRDEANALMRGQILDIMEQFGVDGQQQFYLDELALETDVPVRRALVRGMAQALDRGQYAIPDAAERLRGILRNPDEDWQVRAFAAEAILGEYLNHNELGLLEDVRDAVLASKESRFREAVITRVAGSFGHDSVALVLPELTSLLVVLLDSDFDHDRGVAVATALEASGSSNPEAVIGVIEEISTRLDPGHPIRERLKVAKTILIDGAPGVFNNGRNR